MKQNKSDPNYPYNFPWIAFKGDIRAAVSSTPRGNEIIDLHKARSIIDALIYQLSPRRKIRDVGRPRVKFAPNKLDPLLLQVLAGKVSKRQMARVLGVSQRTVQLICENPKRYREE